MDHKNLEFDKSPVSSRIQRWKLLLSEFGVSLVYLKGEENRIADALSRCLNVVEESKPWNYEEYIECVFLEYNHPGEKKLENAIR